MKKSKTMMFNEFLRLLDIYLNYKMDQEEKKKILDLANEQLSTFLNKTGKGEKLDYRLTKNPKTNLIKLFKTYYKKPDFSTKKLILENRYILADRQAKRNKARNIDAALKTRDQYLRVYSEGFEGEVWQKQMN